MRQHMVQRQAAFAVQMQQRLQGTLADLERYQAAQVQQLELRLAKQLEQIRRSQFERRSRVIRRVFDEYRQWVADTLSTEPEPTCRSSPRCAAESRRGERPCQLWKLSRPLLASPMKTSYSHHYLSEVLKGDIKERLEQWAVAEETHPEQRAPYKQLASWASQWFALRNTVSHGATAAEQLDSFRHVQHGLLQGSRVHQYPQHLELQAGMPVPVWQVIVIG